MNLVQDPVSKLMLPRQFIDQKQALKKVIDDLVDKTVEENQHIKETYYLTLHAKFNKLDPEKFEISTPIISFRLPPFSSNQLVFWVNNQKGIVELLWMVRRGPDGKLKPEFNTQGVAYLQAKGAMPS